MQSIAKKEASFLKKRKKDAPLERIETPSFTDPQGSWTGVPLDPADEPVQDADDL